MTGITLTTGDPGQIELILQFAGLTPATRTTPVTLDTFLTGAILTGVLPQLITSRRSKVLRVRWPLRPAKPLFAGQQIISAPGPGGGLVDTVGFQLNYNGDQRNIYGFEVRAADNATILVQAAATTFADLFVDLSQTPFLYLDPPLNSDYNLFAYFFNQNWRYSEPLVIVLEPSRDMWPWSPGFEPPVSGDNEFVAYGFGARQDYEDDAAGNPIASESIQGIPIPKLLSPDVGPPVIRVDVSDGSGGTIKAGQYAIGVSAYDAPPASGTNFGVSALSNIVNVVVTADNSAMAIDLIWDEGSVGGGLFVASPDQFSGWHHEADISEGTGTFFLTAIGGKSYGAPDALFDHFVVKFKKETYSGLECTVVGVTSNTVSVSGVAFTTNQFAGHTMSLLAYDNIAQNVGIVDLPVSSNTSGGTFTFSTGPNLTTVIHPGDVVTFRMRPQNITEQGFGDPTLAISGSLLISPGDLAWIIAGPGYGQANAIASLSSTGIVLAQPWTVLPTTGSLIVIVEPTWSAPVPTQAIDTFNSLSSSGQLMEPTIPNLAAQTWITMVLTADVNGNVSSDMFSPLREIHYYGQPGSGVEVDRATFGIGIGAAQLTGNDLTNHFMVRFPNFGGTFIEALANCKLPAASGGPLIIDIRKSTDQGSTWNSVFPASGWLTIPVNSTLEVSTTTFASIPNNAVAPGDWLRIDLLSGSNTDSMGIEVVIRWGIV